MCSTSYREVIKRANFTIWDKIGQFIPAFIWLRSYQWKDWIWSDIAAGVAVAIMVVPQGMSYAQNLAFLPQVYGIYGAFVPTIVYALLGSTKHVAVGPVAVTSLLLGSGLTRIFGDFQINPSHPDNAYQAALQERYNHGAIQVSFIAGCMYTAVGVFRLGFIVNYLSAPVISGFMTGAASIILSTQIKYVTGMYYVPRSDTLIHSLQLLYQNMTLFRWPEFAMGSGFIIILLLCQFLGARYRRVAYLAFLGPIIVTVLSLIIENAGKYYVIDYNNPATPYIKDVGKIPSGLGEVTVSWWFPLYNVSQQLLLAGIICILDIAESTTVARRVAQQKRYKINFTQELRALGFANLLGSMFNCYTTTGAFSRTAVNAAAGAKTLMSSFVTGFIVMILLLAAMPIFTHLSVNVQGAIVIVAVLPLLDFKGACYFWDVSKLDFLTWFVTYFVCCTAGALAGIASGLALSIVIVLLRSGFPRMSTIGRMPDPNLYSDPELYPQAADVQDEINGVIAMRVEAPMWFGNVAVVTNRIEDEIALRRAKGEKVCVVILDISMTPTVDAAFTETMYHYLNELEDEHISLILVSPTRSVLLTLQRSGLLAKIQPENIQMTMDDALKRAAQVMDISTKASDEISTAEDKA